jgi:CubicO group peptidase (beta-lactamase class C family)
MRFVDIGCAKIMRKTQLLSLLVLLILSSCNSLTSTDEAKGSSQRSTVSQNATMSDDLLINELESLGESPVLTSFLIAQNGKIIFEEYYNGSDESQSTNIQSVTKSLISALIGIALREGYIKGVDQKISDFFPSYFPRKDDPIKNDLTLQHLLTMSAGFQWKSDEPMYRDDPIEAIISQPLETEPGETFHYNSGLPHVLSIIITQESGMSTREFAERYLFEPLEITVNQWNSVNGYQNGCCELWLTARDLVKIGILYLNQGKWEKEQLIPPNWVQESTKFHIEADDGNGYGYYWWLTPLNKYEVISALGWGGQFIHIIPDLDLVIVGTKNISELPENDPYEYELIEEYIIPSAKK